MKNQKQINPWELEGNEFFSFARKEFHKENIYSNIIQFHRDQLEHLKLITEKYRNDKKAGNKLSLTANHFVKAKQAIDYFESLSEDDLIDWEINHYLNVNISVPFRKIYHTFSVINDLLKPLNLNFDKYVFFKRLFNNIIFEKISDQISVENIFEVKAELPIKEGLEIFQKIFTHLASYKEDIDFHIHRFQLAIGKLSERQIIEIKKDLIANIGSLKLQTKDTPNRGDFHKRYFSLTDQLKKEPFLRDEDYMMLIANFNEVVLFDLLSSFEIVLSSLDKINLNPKDSEQLNTGEKILPFQYGTFDELIEDAFLYEAIKSPKNAAHKGAILSYYNFTFNQWLQENKGWEYENEMQYKQQLTKQNFIDFLKYEEENKIITRENFEREKKSWQVSSLRKVENIASVRPLFRSDIVGKIFDLLKGFFIVDQLELLKFLLETGDNVISPITFLDNGNRLADAFKQLKEKDLITGCDKQQLQAWIAQNFLFQSKGQVKSFTSDYIEKCISRNYYPCKNPLFKIEKGEIKENN